MTESASPLERPGRARSKIHQAALRVFAESGGSEITISELAEAAGLARGTIYNNVDAPENLFAEVGAALSHEMIERTEATMRALTDPAARIATGMRLFVRRAHEEHDWGRFLVRFAMSYAVLQAMMHEPPVRDVRRAIAAKRFTIEPAQAPALISMMNGATLSAMRAVIAGEQTWRDAGSNGAELLLRAGGVSAKEARAIARTTLPDLAIASNTTKRKKS